MCLHIPDEILKQAGLSERDALIEIACRLFDADKISKPAACRLAGVARVDLERALHERGLTVYRTTLEDFELDMASLRRLGETESRPANGSSNNGI